MPKPLVIVESPAKAKTIAAFLGSDFMVESSIGHIRDLPRNAKEVPVAYKGEPWARLAVDVDNDFKPLYIVSAEKKKQVAKLKAALKNASELYLATDEDREGEAIAWHLMEVLNPRVPVKRMVFHEITQQAIAEAVENWRELDRRLVDAQEARRILDRLVGWDVSEVLWKKVMPRLSAGRVQSVATRLVVDRERRRVAFRSGGYWDAEGSFVAHGVAFRATLTSVGGKRVVSGKDFDPATGQLADPSSVVLLGESGARGLVERLEGAPFTVSSLESRDYSQSPSAPFITSTLQQEAGRKLRFTAARAMQVAQRLYERGYITYMRTDSTNLSGQAVTAAREQIRTLYGDDYLTSGPRTFGKKSKNAQEAHEAIRPSGERFRTTDEVRGELDADEARLYDLVWKRTVASQMADARGKRVALRLGATSSDGTDVVFAASGKTIQFPGFLRAYVEGADDPEAELEDQEVQLPAVSEGEPVQVDRLEPAGHETQPPARYTEASLVKELESRGIGRPSTYASVLQTIQDRGYVWKKGTALVPAWVAFSVVRLLEEHFGHLVDYEFTARMEEDLDGIARGEKEAVPWLRHFYLGNGQVGLKGLVEERMPIIDAREINSIVLGSDSNGEEIVVRVGRYGPYLTHGDARASLPTDLAPDELTMDKAAELLAAGHEDGRVLGTDPESGLPVIVRNGRYGPYVQVGEFEDGAPSDAAAPGGKKAKLKTEKPRTASLFKTMSIESVTFDDALRLLMFPRTVGTDLEGAEIVVQNGRYGPYLKRGTDTRSLESEDQLFTLTTEEALLILAQPKRRGRSSPPVLAELGEHPDSKIPLRVLSGRYGPYVTDGTVNASLPRGADPETLSVDEAVGLLLERAAKGGGTRTKRPVAKKSARKKAVKRSAVKKTAAKKTAAKKAVNKTAASPTADSPEATG